jgi:hypothetical protein
MNQEQFMMDLAQEVSKWTMVGLCLMLVMSSPCCCRWYQEKKEDRNKGACSLEENAQSQIVKIFRRDVQDRCK